MGLHSVAVIALLLHRGVQDPVPDLVLDRILQNFTGSGSDPDLIL